MSRRQSLETPDEMSNAKKLLYSVAPYNRKNNSLLCAKPAIMLSAPTCTRVMCAQGSYCSYIILPHLAIFKNILKSKRMYPVHVWAYEVENRLQEYVDLVPTNFTIMIA